MLEIDKKHENQLPQAREENHIDIYSLKIHTLYHLKASVYELIGV